MEEMVGMIAQMFRPVGSQYFKGAILNIFAIVCNKVRIHKKSSQVLLIS